MTDSYKPLLPITTVEVSPGLYVGSTREINFTTSVGNVKRIQNGHRVQYESNLRCNTELMGALSNLIRSVASGVIEDVPASEIAEVVQKQIERINNPTFTVDQKIWLNDLAYLLPLDRFQWVEFSPSVVETPNQKHFKIYFELRGEPHLLRAVVDQQSDAMETFDYCFYFQGRYAEQLPVTEEAQFTYWTYFRDRIVHEFKVNGDS